MLLHPSSSSPLPLPITSASTIIGSLTTPLCLLILAIPLYSFTNNMSWIDYHYQDNVNTTDALIVFIQMILVGFVLHMVGGMYVVMLLG
jgi:hypothetical protein